MSENYFYSSLSGQEIESTLLGAVRGDVAQSKSTSWKAQARQNIGAGSENTGFQILGYFDTLADLQEYLQLPPQPGDAYGIGTEPPYNIYVWDGANSEWVDNGTLDIAEFIDDSETSAILTWSSQKISTELSGKATPSDVAALVDDSTTSASKTWSSNKISSELSGKATPSDVAALVDDSTTSASKTWSSQKIAAEISSAVAWELAWTNSDPTSSFSEQEIQLDLSSKTMVLVEYVWSTSASNSVMCMIPVRTGTVGAVALDVRDGKIAQRRAYATTTLVHFYDAFFSNTYGSNALNNSYCIPLSIYAQ